ncbi:MAG TPA: ATP-binding protein [Giesbergeria sp.]|jgi:predicted AAA+ superfamily ATPase|nr:ATP-binding protein [Burkholderiaceae bacterium]HMZ86656.1 ATP-binding protein [Giesbergeria sp.]HNE73154.1 ATP-binding protein [Giesbergeria sp.]HNM40486.1 ATP-binding protein [Giesbergeria sp.]HNQ10461.1 ATP-binding protein [Giesbergeria sp.]
MFERKIMASLREDLASTPAVALLGPRQAGKTTVAHELAQQSDNVYLDLESELDRAKLASPELYLAERLDRLVVLDEVHRVPGLFPVLRGLIDRARRSGRRSGLYLLLGSASLDLLQQAGESLAGRIAYRELTPFNVQELPEAEHTRLWVRGGFPESYLARTPAASLRWRQDFIRTYVERDIPLFGGRVGSEALRRLWGMLAHQQGALVNASVLARSLALDMRTVNRYLDLLVEMFLVRRLEPWHANLGKRLTKSPKLYVRDSGLLHALLGLPDEEALLGHPAVGASWEGFVLENLITAAGTSASAHFYRTSGGAEVDLLLNWPSGECWAIEVKRSLAPKVERGFHSACEDLQPTRKLVIYPGDEPFPLGHGVQAMPLATLCHELAMRAYP